MYNRKSGGNTKVLYAIFPSLPKEKLLRLKKSVDNLLGYFLQYLAPLSKSYYESKKAYYQKYITKKNKLKNGKHGRSNTTFLQLKNNYQNELQFLEEDAIKCSIKWPNNFRLTQKEMQDKITKINYRSLDLVPKPKWHKLYGKHIICNSFVEAQELIIDAMLQEDFDYTNLSESFVLREGYAAIVKFNLYNDHYFKLRSKDIDEYVIYRFNQKVIAKQDIGNKNLNKKNINKELREILNLIFPKEFVCKWLFNIKVHNPIFVYKRNDFYKRHAQLVLMVKLVYFINVAERNACTNACTDVLMHILSFFPVFTPELNDKKRDQNILRETQFSLKNQDKIREITIKQRESIKQINKKKVALDCNNDDFLNFKKVRSRDEIRFMVEQLSGEKQIKKIGKFFQSKNRSKLIIKHKNETKKHQITILLYFTSKFKSLNFIKKIIKPCFSCNVL